MARKQVLQSTVENKQNEFDLNQFTIIYDWVIYKHWRGLDDSPKIIYLHIRNSLGVL